MIKRIEMLRELIKSLNLPAEKAQEIIQKEPIYIYRKTKFGFTFVVVAITNSSARKILENWEKFESFGEANMEDNGIARIVKIYGVDYTEIKKAKELLNQIKMELKKERGI